MIWLQKQVYKGTLEWIIALEEGKASVLAMAKAKKSFDKIATKGLNMFVDSVKELIVATDSVTKDFEKATKAAKNLSKKQMVSDLWHRSQLLRQLEFKVETQNLSTTELNAIKEEWSSIPDSNHQTITTLNAATGPILSLTICTHSLDIVSLSLSTPDFKTTKPIGN